MEICLVAAAAENNVLGKEGKLVWHLPNDLRFFKNITWGTAVAMGRKTFDSISNKPLKGRYNIVITRQQNYPAPSGVHIAAGLTEAVDIATKAGYKQLMIVGGGEIYKMALPFADIIFLTRVHTNPEGDAYFPDFGNDTWHQESNEAFTADEKHAFAYSIQKWIRKKAE
jgi:dihydrofolate reductase